jgi:hypothetical protein
MIIGLLFVLLGMYFTWKYTGDHASNSKGDYSDDDTIERRSEENYHTFPVFQTYHELCKTWEDALFAKTVAIPHEEDLCPSNGEPITDEEFDQELEDYFNN